MATGVYGEVKTSGTPGNVLTENAAGTAPTFQAPGAATGVINNTASTVPQRDTKGGLYFSQGMIQSLGTTNAISPTFATSNTCWNFVGTGATTDTMTVTLPAVTTGTNVLFTFIHTNTAQSVLTINTPATNAMFMAYSGGFDTTSFPVPGSTKMQASSPGSVITLLGFLSGTVTNYIPLYIRGSWKDRTNNIAYDQAVLQQPVEIQSTAITLDPDDVGHFWLAGTTARTFTLPAAGAGVVSGQTLTFYQVSTGVLTIGANSNTIQGLSGGTFKSSTTTLTSPGQGASVTLTYRSPNIWYITAINGTWT